MTQRQQIQMLNSIMPEIVESKDPEATMLKCAKKNNLSPAQLEKLGHVFNSMKTLVGLEKQANRGDSFSIVDVPEMVSKYTTYDPERVLSDKAEAVHSKVDKLTKYASSDPDGWGECLKFMQMSKSASANNDWCFEKQTLPSCTEWIKKTATRTNEGGAIEFNNTEVGDEWLEMDPDGVNADIMHKAAASRLKLYNAVNNDLDEAEMTLRQVVEEAGVAVQEKLANFKAKILSNKEDWATCIMDAQDLLPGEEFSKVASIVESYFEKNKVRGFEKIATISRGYTPRLARDTTGLVSELQEIADLQAAKDKALDLLEGFSVKSASKSSTADLINALSFEKFHDKVDKGLEKWHEATKEMRDNPFDYDTSLQLDYDKSLDNGLREVTLQKLMLTDPIIAEADQATVQDLFNTIADLSPTIAKDPIRMAPVLKEALQYDALPMQQIKDLLSVEESAGKVKKLQREEDESKKVKI
jgi:hypothetical protein